MRVAMKVLSNLTIKNLKLNKSRTIVTLIGIILSTALLVALSGLASSFANVYIEETLANSGNYHVLFANVPAEELSTITLHKEVESYQLIESFPELSFDYMTEESDTEEGVIEDSDTDESGTVVALDENALLDNEDRLTEGRLPENSSEVLLDSDYVYNEILIGDEITLSNGATYTVVGKIDNLKAIDFWRPVILYMDEVEESAYIAVTYEHVKDYASITADIIGPEQSYQYYNNTAVLKIQAQAMSDSSLRVIYSMSLVVALIIIMTSVFCIRNSFAISITEKVRQYGMLASVGATPKQIRQNVLFEAFLLGLIGIPLGVISGIFAVAVLLQITNYLIVDTSGSIQTGFGVVINPYLVVFAVALAALTILLSSVSSALRASRISEIDAIRSTQDIKMNGKRVKIPSYIERLFGIGGVFAYKNMKRNKRKFRTTTISLIVSIATFISLSSFLNLGFQMAEDEFQEMGYNIAVKGEDAEEIYDYVKNMENVEQYSYQKSYPAYVEFEDGSGSSGLYVITMSEEYYMTYLEENDITYEEDQYILLDKGLTISEDGKYVEEYIYDGMNEIDIWLGADFGAEMTITSYVRPEEYPMTRTRWETGIIVSNAQFEEIIINEDAVEYDGIYIESSDADALEIAIYEYAEAEDMDISIENIGDYERQMTNMLLLISIFLYGFITVIILVGLTNIFNSLSTNMNMRRKEFATLQSIGMTDKEFNHMITFECISYVVKSLLWGIPIGLLGSLALYRASEGWYIDYGFVFPYRQIIIATVVVFVVVYSIMRTSLGKISKQNIIETIRQENI